MSVVAAPAEALPFPDGAFDTVVSTLVLCTVPDPEAAIAEIARVLRPGGALLFIEHVRGHGRLAHRQDRLAAPWRAFAAGCNCNRDTVGALARGGLSADAVRTAAWRGMPSIVRPLVIGEARA